MTNKENFLNLVSAIPAETANRNQERIRNRAMLKESQNIALKVLLKLDELGWNQRRLAKEMGVTPQQVNKIVSGKENLTIDTLVKLQRILEMPLLASYYEKQNEQLEVADTVFFGSTEKYTLAKVLDGNYNTGLVYKTEIRKFASSYSTQAAV
jgi:transcriptional regulator with XRE-family HTH domain